MSTHTFNRKHTMNRITLGLALSLLTAVAQAQMSPLGLWRSIDDETKQAKAEIRISQNASGALSGVVERSLLATPSAEPNCNLCTDDRKDKPKIGMEIIRGGQQADGKLVSPPLRAVKSSKFAGTSVPPCWAGPKPGSGFSESLMAPPPHHKEQHV